MDEIILFSYGSNVIFVIVAAVVIWALLRLFDHLNDDKWSDARRKIHTDARACAHYYGMRILGFCILVGLLLS